MSPVPTLLLLAGMDEYDFSGFAGRIALVRSFQERAVGAWEVKKAAGSALAAWSTSLPGGGDVTFNLLKDGLHAFVNPKNSLLPFSLRMDATSEELARWAARAAREGALPPRMPDILLSSMLDAFEQVQGLERILSMHLADHPGFREAATRVIGMLQVLMSNHGRACDKDHAFVTPPSPWADGTLSLDGGKPVPPAKLKLLLADLPVCVQLGAGMSDYRLVGITNGAKLPYGDLDPIGIMRAARDLDPKLDRPTTLSPSWRRA